MPRNAGHFSFSRTKRVDVSVLVLARMRRVRLLLVFSVELVVEVYEVVIEVIVEIVVVVLEILVVHVLALETFAVAFPPALDIVVTVFIVIIQIVLEILVLGVILWCPLRQPRFSLPVVRETPRGLQHGAHCRDLLVIRPKRARSSPRVTTSFYRSLCASVSAAEWTGA